MSNNSPLNIQRGEIWNINLPPPKGHEQGGNRPGLVLTISYGVIIVIPCTTNLERLKFDHTHYIAPDSKNGLIQDSVALVFQITSISPKRFINKLGIISPEDFEIINTLLADLLKFEIEKD
jgi:mRNA-degrading endonuclease toxin of MazEF toxin-antitoxin module